MSASTLDRTPVAVSRLLGTIAIAVAWLIPNHYPPWTSFYNDGCAALGLLLISLCVAALRPAPGMPGLAWAVLALAVIPWCQWATGLLRFSGDAWISTLYILGFTTAISTGFRWARVDPKALATTLSIATLVAAMVSSLLAMTQVFGQWSLGVWMMDIQEGMRPGGNMAQSNNLATLLGLGAIALLLLREQNRISPASALAILAPLMLALCLTQSRVALLFGPVTWIGLWIAVRRGAKFQTRLRTIGLVTAASWLLMWGEPTILRGALLTSLQPFQSVASRGVQSLRFEVWPILFDGLSLHPWHGYGWLQVGAAELAVADRHPPVRELWLHGHNLFVELLIWCGYPLGLLLSGAVVYWFVTRAMRVVSIEGVVGMLVVSIAGVHAMTELPYQYAYFLLPVGLWMGQVESSMGSPALRGPSWHLATMAASLALCLAICWDYGAVEEDLRLARFENLKIGSIHAAQPAPDAPFLSSLTEYLRLTRTLPRPGMSAAELEQMRDVVERYPYASLMSRYAQALALNGRPAEARLMFTKILHIHGEGLYASVKAGLHEAALVGPPELKALEVSISP